MRFLHFFGLKCKGWIELLFLKRVLTRLYSSAYVGNMKVIQIFEK